MSDLKTKPTRHGIGDFIPAIGHDFTARVGKHKTGRSCLYVKMLHDVDPAVIEELVERSAQYASQRYPAS